MKNKKIFILLNDYTKLSLSTKYGVHLAKELKNRATILAIERINTPAMVGGNLPSYPLYQDFEVIKRKANQYLRKLCLDLRHIWKEVDWDVAVGFSNQEVITLMDKKDPYLLAIEGRSDLTTLNEWFGTYETKIAERANCPVLVIQAKTIWRPIQKILYIMDMDDAKSDNLKILTTLTEHLDAHLQVIMISSKGISEADDTYQELISEFRNLLGHKELTFHRIFGDKKAENVIGFVDAISPDWLAFEQKNKNVFERIFNHYNTKRLILQSEIPVLVF